LNLLTAGNTLAAAKDEIQTGVRVALDPPLDALRHPAFGRKPTKHEIMAYTYAGRLGHDDTLEFNTQVSEQKQKQKQKGRCLESVSSQLSPLAVAESPRFRCFYRDAPGKHDAD
jgi:hypothetical protein